MNDSEPTNPNETDRTHAASSATSETSVAGGPGGGSFVLSPAPASLPDESAPVPKATQERWPRVRRLLWNKGRRWIVAAVAMTAVIGLSVGLAASNSASAQPLLSSTHATGGSGFAGGGSNARSGPAAGGASGTVGRVSKSGFTMTTSAGQSVTIDETSTTKYEKKTSSTSKSAIRKGESVLVLGTVSSTTIKATKVIVQVTGGTASSTSSASQVIPFQQGAPTTSKQVGQIPANWSQGEGTIVSGTAANRATEAALAAYPGAIVDRVVKLSNGEYNVHYIGVNWPHHVFVNQDFKVVGAE
jgi:hypothetical protein